MPLAGLSVANALDRRVVPEPVVRLILACQARVPCHLGGGAALSGLFLHHRRTRDVDLFCHQPDEVRELVRDLPRITQEAGLGIEIVRDAGTFVRATVSSAEVTIELDIVHDGTRDIEAPYETDEGVLVESFVDLRAAKLTCILSRSEPRDLVDVLFLDRVGFPPEQDLVFALKKDGGMDPGVLAWLLGEFPVHPLPMMLEPLTEQGLLRFRDELRERFRRMAVPVEE